MQITWLGHSCFLLEQDGCRIVLDPYTGVPGYPPLHVQAHEVLCSHGHFDHNAVDCVTLLPSQPSPFTLREVASWHDDQHGALRGSNTIRILTAGGVTVAHLGDLGHPLSPEQLAQIGPVDGVLVPVGGVYTLDAAGAKAVCTSLSPRWVVPMHGRHGVYGLREVADIADFLHLWSGEQVHLLNSSTFTPTAETAGVLALSFSPV